MIVSPAFHEMTLFANVANPSGMKMSVCVCVCVCVYVSKGVL